MKQEYNDIIHGLKQYYQHCFSLNEIILGPIDVKGKMRTLQGLFLVVREDKWLI